MRNRIRRIHAPARACAAAHLIALAAALATGALAADPAHAAPAALAAVDSDHDGRPNTRDRDVDGDGRRNRRDADIDGDGKRNGFDQDIDGDRVNNPWDADSDSSGQIYPLSSARGQSVDPEFFGLISDDALWGTETDPVRARTMEAIAVTGVRSLRAAFSWAMIEPQPGRYDFSFHDAYVRAAALHGLRVMPILFDPPSFRSTSPADGAARGAYPPSDVHEFAAYARRLVERYGSGGEFWREHPELPQLAVRRWQVWNEPNIRQFWASGPDPAAYAEMLKAAAPAIKAADPSAIVVAAGLNESELGIKLVPFLRGMYAAGAKGSFDVLAVHPYAPASDLVVDQIVRAVRVLQANGDDARVLVTEIGWATGGTSGRALVVGESGQEALLKRTTAQLVRMRAALRLDGVFYFNWRDAPPPPGGSEHWGLHTGLLRQDGSAKPAIGALTSLTRSLGGGRP